MFLSLFNIIMLIQENMILNSSRPRESVELGPFIDLMLISSSKCWSRYFWRNYHVILVK